MTTAEKQSTISLRSQGLGYKLIAKELGVSPDSVRSYLKTKDAQSKIVLLPHKPDGITCPFCGIKLEKSKYNPKKLFCSDKCRTKYWLKNSRTYICTECSKPFNPTHKSQKYCSLECYFTHRFRKGGDSASIR